MVDLDLHGLAMRVRPSNQDGVPLVQAMPALPFHFADDRPLDHTPSFCTSWKMCRGGRMRLTPRFFPQKMQSSRMPIPEGMSNSAPAALFQGVVVSAWGGAICPV